MRWSGQLSFPNFMHFGFVEYNMISWAGIIRSAYVILIKLLK